MSLLVALDPVPPISYDLGLAGSGQLLGNAPRRTLKLVDSVSWPSGIVLNTYHRADS